MTESSVQGVIYAMLGAGGATFIWTVVKSVIAYKNSAEGREDRAVGRLEEFERNCREQLAYERRWGAYWSRRATVLERTLITHGIEPPTPPPEPTPDEP